MTDDLYVKVPVTIGFDYNRIVGQLSISSEAARELVQGINVLSPGWRGDDMDLDVMGLISANDAVQYSDNKNAIPVRRRIREEQAIYYLQQLCDQSPKEPDITNLPLLAARFFLENLDDA